MQFRDYFGKYLPHLARKFLAPSLKSPINFLPHTSIVGLSYPFPRKCFSVLYILQTSSNCISSHTCIIKSWLYSALAGERWQRLYAHILPSPSLPHRWFILSFSENLDWSFHDVISWKVDCFQWQRLYAHILLSPSLPHQIFRLATPLHRRHNYEQSQQTKPSIASVMQKQTMGIAKTNNTIPHISHHTSITLGIPQGWKKQFR